MANDIRTRFKNAYNAFMNRNDLAHSTKERICFCEKCTFLCLLTGKTIISEIVDV